MRNAKSTPSSMSGKIRRPQPLAGAASARFRGLKYLTACLADLREDHVERELYEQREIEQHLRSGLRYV